MSHSEIRSEGLKSGEAPAETLEKLFTAHDVWVAPGYAAAHINYEAFGAPSRVGGYTYVCKAALSQYDYTVARDFDGKLDITIHNYVDPYWYRGRSGGLDLGKDHVRNKLRERQLLDELMNEQAARGY